MNANAPSQPARTEKRQRSILDVLHTIHDSLRAPTTTAIAKSLTMSGVWARSILRDAREDGFATCAKCKHSQVMRYSLTPAGLAMVEASELEANRLVAAAKSCGYGPPRTTWGAAVYDLIVERHPNPRDLHPTALVADVMGVSMRDVRRWRTGGCGPQTVVAAAMAERCGFEFRWSAAGGFSASWLVDEVPS